MEFQSTAELRKQQHRTFRRKHQLRVTHQYHNSEFPPASLIVPSVCQASVCSTTERCGHTWPEYYVGQVNIDIYVKGKTQEIKYRG